MADELEAIPTSNLSALTASTPELMIAKATTYATALGTVINDRKLFTLISGKKHVNIEGWSTLGTLLGVMPFIEWSRQCPGENEADMAFEARCILKTMSGQVVGSGESMAAKSEGGVWGKKMYSIRSMAETRATGKAFRLSFAWIMKLAGYDGLPLEEADRPEKADSEQVANEKEKQRIITHISNSRNDSDLAHVLNLVSEYGLTDLFEAKQKEFDAQ